MADERPVCEVLCDAMEYLCKLGSNLRSRSENLKEKKIKREKLNNAHAVQKAANKVLLICELSKKSLENVEIGVKNILSIVDASQANDGAKSLKFKDDKHKYQYFYVGPHKVKISRKVPLKHYTSVKVLAKSMPITLQEKYPVYYNCKLYRQRKRNIKEPTDIGLQITTVSSESKGHAIDETKKDIINCSVNDETTKFYTENKDEENSELLKKVANVHGSNKKSKHFEIVDSSSDESKNKKCLLVNNSKCNSTDELNKDLEKDNSQVIKNNIGEKIDNGTDPDDKMKELSNSNDIESNESETVSSKKSYNDCSSDSDHSECSSKQSFIKCVNINKLLKPHIIKNKPENLTKKVKRKDKKTSVDSVISENSLQISSIVHKKSDEYWEEKRKEVSAFKPKSFVIKVLRLPKFSITYLNENNLKRISCNGETLCQVTSHLKDNNSAGRNETNSEKKIECDKSNTKSELLIDSGFDKKKESSPLKSSEDDLHYIKKSKNVLLFDSDSDKAEVNKAFVLKHTTDESNKNKKSKSALLSDSDSDKAGREASLPKDLAEDTNNIKKSLLNETDSDQGQEREDKSLENKSADKSTENEDTNKIKKALLNESDSDQGQERDNNSLENVNNDKSTENGKSKEEQINAKNMLLNESDSEEEKVLRKVDYSDGQSSVKRALCYESNSEIGELKKSTEGNDNTISSSVECQGSQSRYLVDNLDENLTQKSVETPNTPNNKRKRLSSDTPRSKRKNIMKSMHAKKMLLTYSSSDTEDEQLKNALKEIKESLRRGISSDEENGSKKPEEKSQVKRKIYTSSDSGEDGSDQKKESKEAQNPEDSEKDTVKDTSSINQIDGNMDELSNSSSSKMGRSRGKPGSSSNQNSDSQDGTDKDIDGLINLKTLKKKRLRHRSSSTDNTQTTTSSSMQRKVTKTALKAPRIAEEQLLESEDSGSESSAAGSEPAEELPAVALSTINGGAIDHLAKDDLLEESDSSSSQDQSSQEKKDEDSDENVKTTRRKAIAISSDDDAGFSKKKGKLSDFEDSDADSAEPAKKSKRKKKVSDSDASFGSSSSGGTKKKRRRIKSVKDSDASGSDSENEGRNKHGRKNIRKVMGKDQLEEATKKAAREEKERMARIIERQKMYNNLAFDESGKPDEVVLDRVVLDFDPETKEPLIQVDKGLVKKLKPHQANGIKFMWDACFESVKRIKKDKGSGCILAHCMGLGKTLQVVSLTHTLLTHSSLTSVNRVLVVCPLSTVLNWVNEFHMWLKHAESDYEVDVYELSKYKQNSERAFQLSQWFQHGGVCVLGYEMFRNLSADNPKKYKKKMLKNFQESLVDPGPDMVVCDEGHLLKNEKTSLSQSMNRVRTNRRIVLTGTPLQNNLKEYYCMVQFVKPNLLGKYNEYLNRFVNPITNGQYTDSTEYDIKVMKRRSHVLHKMLDGAVQRRDYGVLAPFLPPKHEYVLFITLTEVQIKLYQYYLDNYSRRPLAGKSSGFLFPDFQSLQRIWTHPLVLKYNSERYEIMQQKKRDKEEEDSEGSLVDFIDDDSTPEETSTEESLDDLSDVSDDSRKKSKKKKSPKKSKSKESKLNTRRGTRANPGDLDDENVPTELPDEVKHENPTEWWIKLVTDDELEDLRNSHKLVLLFDILKQCEIIGDKLLVFSQSLYSLDLIEHFLGKVDEATQDGKVDEKLGSHVGSWSPGIDYFRLDGSTSCENRSIWCKNFNKEDNPRARLFLISTRAGGLGINLVAANRVVIFDVSWNPSHDVQSIFRVYRFGQKKPCYVYRFLAMGTMEEKIYERQVTKQAISKRVIDEQQIDRHYAENDLAELYKFDPVPPQPRPTPNIPKDRLFAEMLMEHAKQIYKFHEHDSLLENKEEETLSEEERKAAWEDFENEKTRPPPVPFANTWPMHNGMSVNPGLLAQQQQQLAFAALATMLRKDMPNMTENQIRDMLPLIYNANPALMQKMSEIYKYPQAGMMNPMMNPVMNPGGAGLGGASGLQYEPPWQRQQQQQQQMRLQQMMHQQNQMGAKFYAGGLGSRDPVAMALQQARAREIMLGDRGRPRGRPPLQPRAPPAGAAATGGDVVDLDSD